jgi:hypothetical protein
MVQCTITHSSSSSSLLPDNCYPSRSQNTLPPKLNSCIPAPLPSSVFIPFLSIIPPCSPSQSSCIHATIARKLLHLSISILPCHSLPLIHLPRMVPFTSLCSSSCSSSGHCCCC